MKIAADPPRRLPLQATPRRPSSGTATHLGMDFVLAIAEDHVPSTHAPDPYMHLFMDAGNGNVLAFFELPNSPRWGATKTPRMGAAHRLQGREACRNWKRPRPVCKPAGIDVVGVTDHTIFKSIYFFDPNGHRLELAADTATPDMRQARRR
jgi:catechol 2,3-dioxygenase-like lactoylglutathione lyase family enzyme